MDLETAKKLNEVLKPFGYTVGKIHMELKQYEAALEIANINLKYSNLTDEEFNEKKENIKALDMEYLEIRCIGNRDIPQSTFYYRDLLNKIGFE
jgi:hypothetical protein